MPDSFQSSMWLHTLAQYLLTVDLGPIDRLASPLFVLQVRLEPTNRGF